MSDKLSQLNANNDVDVNVKQNDLSSSDDTAPTEAGQAELSAQNRNKLLGIDMQI